LPFSIHQPSTINKDLMDALFWQRMHGGSTHFPIVLLMASVAAVMILAAALMIGAGYWGGEMLLRAEGGTNPATGSKSSSSISGVVAHGRDLFLANCAHCHGADAAGDEGPDLHGEKKSDTRIASLIKDGIPGEMPRFNSKLSNTDVQALITYIHSLR
jgi:mono/diheme cytochrome c family protein